MTGRETIYHAACVYLRLVSSHVQCRGPRSSRVHSHKAHVVYTSRADCCAIVPLGFLAGGPQTLINWTDIAGEAPFLEPAAGVMFRPLHDWGQDSADRSLHAAGPTKNRTATSAWTC